VSRRGPDPSAVGIGLAFVGMLVLTLTPVAGRWAEIPPGLAATALGAALLLIVVGAALGLAAGRENSGRTLEQPAPDEADRDRGS